MPKMRPQRDAAKSHQRDEQCRARNSQRPPVARLQRRQDKKQELAIKQRRTNGVATGKTVAGPIDERPVNKWTMSMDELLEQLV